MAKVISIYTRKPLDWQTWLLNKSQQPEVKEAQIRMMQNDVWSIFLDLVASENPEQAFEVLKSRIETRRHLNYWLGQIGHRQDVRLGLGKDFHTYMKAVSSCLWQRSNGLRS